MTSSTLGTPRHIDPGTYEVRAPDGLTQGPIVGYVHVEGHDGQRVEHWVLFPVLAPHGPGTRTELRPSPRGTCASLASFFDEMRAHETVVGPLTYLRSTCEYQRGVP